MYLPKLLFYVSTEYCLHPQLYLLHDCVVAVNSTCGTVFNRPVTRHAIKNTSSKIAVVPTPSFHFADRRLTPALTFLFADPLTVHRVRRTFVKTDCNRSQIFLRILTFLICKYLIWDIRFTSGDCLDDVSRRYQNNKLDCACPTQCR